MNLTFTAESLDASSRFVSHVKLPERRFFSNTIQSQSDLPPPSDIFFCISAISLRTVLRQEPAHLPAAVNHSVIQESTTAYENV